MAATEADILLIYGSVDLDQAHCTLCLLYAAPLSFQFALALRSNTSVQFEAPCFSEIGRRSPHRINLPNSSFGVAGRSGLRLAEQSLATVAPTLKTACAAEGYGLPVTQVGHGDGSVRNIQGNSDTLLLGGAATPRTPWPGWLPVEGEREHCLKRN